MVIYFSIGVGDSQAAHTLHGDKANWWNFLYTTVNILFIWVIFLNNLFIKINSPTLIQKDVPLSYENLLCLKSSSYRVTQPWIRMLGMYVEKTLIISYDTLK